MFTMKKYTLIKERKCNIPFMWHGHELIPILSKDIERSCIEKCFFYKNCCKSMHSVNCWKTTRKDYLIVHYEQVRRDKNGIILNITENE